MHENYDDDQHNEKVDSSSKRVNNRHRKALESIANIERLDLAYPNIKIPYIEHGFGWITVLEILFAYADEWNKTMETEMMAETDEKKIVFEEIKEKFGSLRIYHTGGPPEFRGMVTMAEMMSQLICERCGDVADRGEKRGYWCQTLCPNCNTSNPKEYSDE